MGGCARMKSVPLSRNMSTPKPVVITVCGQRVFADVLKLRTLGGGHPGLPGCLLTSWLGSHTFLLSTRFLIRDREEEAAVWSGRQRLE